MTAPGTAAPAVTSPTEPRRVVVGTLADLDPATAGPPGITVVRVAEPVRFGTDRRTDLTHLLALREATSHTLLLEWRLLGAPSVALRDCVHLVPPSAGLDAAARDTARLWRDAYRYGSYHHRVGPGFVTVKDVRPDGERARMTIDGDGARIFLDLAASSRVPAEADALDGLAVLEEAGLALRADDVALVLPFRMRHWPVPFLGI